MGGNFRALSRVLNPGLRVIFALGGPGAGKGTVCSLLTEGRDGWSTLSAGALLRAEARDGDEDLARWLAAGRVVPPERSATAILRQLQRLDSAVQVAIVDGFPRDVEAARLWDAHRPGANAFVLQVPETVLRQRLLGRGRTDDNPEVVERRLEYHRQHTGELIKHFGSRVVLLDGVGEPNEVVKRVEQAFRKHPLNVL